MECATRLRLKTAAKESFTYCYFGENESRKGEKDVYKLDVCKVRIRLIGMNTICSTMYTAPVPKGIVKQFQGIPSEEDYEKSRGVQVDILVDLDWYWPLIKKQERRLEGLVAQETAIGWMLSMLKSNILWEEKSKQTT